MSKFKARVTISKVIELDTKFFPEHDGKAVTAETVKSCCDLQSKYCTDGDADPLELLFCDGPEGEDEELSVTIEPMLG